MLCVKDAFPFTSRHGFLQDCAQVPSDPPDLLSPHYTDPPDHNSPHFYVHHTGTALVQLVVEVAPTTEHHQHSPSTTPTSSIHTWKDSHHHPPPQNARNMPLKRSLSSLSGLNNKDSTASDGERTCDVPSGVSKFGFYWYKNYLLPKQKNIPPQLVAKYDDVLETFTKDCKNENKALNQLCDHLFTL